MFDFEDEPTRPDRPALIMRPVLVGGVEMSEVSPGHYHYYKSRRYGSCQFTLVIDSAYDLTTCTLAKQGVWDRDPIVVASCADRDSLQSVKILKAAASVAGLADQLARLMQ